MRVVAGVTACAEFLGFAQADVVVQVAPIVVVAGGKAARAAAIPIALVTGIQIQRAELARFAKGLVDREVGTGFGIARAPRSAGAGVLHMVGQRAVTLGRITIGGEGEAGIGTGEGLCIERADTAALGGFAECLAGRLRNVQGHRANRGVLRRTDGQRLEAVARLNAGNARQIAGQAVGESAPKESRFVIALAVVVELAARQAVLQLPLTHHRRQGGERLPGYLAPTIRFDNGDLQVTVGARWVDITDLERTRRYIGGVENVVVLADLDLRIGFRHATNDRCITALTVCTHAFIRSDLDALVAHAVEQIRIGKDFTRAQLPLDRREVALDERAVADKTVGPAGGAAQVGFVAQTPGTKVDAVAQPQVIGDLRGVIGFAAGAAQLVVDETGGHTLVPKLRIYIAAHATRHGDLRHTDIEAQAVGIEIETRLLDHCRQVVVIGRVLLVNQTLLTQFAHVHTQLLQQFQGDAWLDFAVDRVGREIDIATPDQRAVAEHVDAVLAWQDAVGIQQRLQIDRR